MRDNGRSIEQGFANETDEQRELRTRFLERFASVEIEAIARGELALDAWCEANRTRPDHPNAVELFCLAFDPITIRDIFRSGVSVPAPNANISELGKWLTEIVDLHEQGLLWLSDVIEQGLEQATTWRRVRRFSRNAAMISEVAESVWVAARSIEDHLLAYRLSDNYGAVTYAIFRECFKDHSAIDYALTELAAATESIVTRERGNVPVDVGLPFYEAVRWAHKEIARLDRDYLRSAGKEFGVPAVRGGSLSGMHDGDGGAGRFGGHQIILGAMLAHHGWGADGVTNWTPLKAVEIVEKCRLRNGQIAPGASKSRVTGWLTTNFGGHAGYVRTCENRQLAQRLRKLSGDLPSRLLALTEDPSGEDGAFD